jgi:hypothetical protein
LTALRGPLSSNPNPLVFQKRLIFTHGKVIRFGRAPCDIGSVKAICGNFRLNLVSPFNYAELLRRSREETYTKTLLRKISRDLNRLPWILDIWPDRQMAGGHWTCGNKVLNLYWYDTGPAKLITFRPGSWPARRTIGCLIHSKGKKLLS